MTLQPYSKEELNLFKFASIVLDELPKALRQIFADMWDKIAPLSGYQRWDDSPTVRNMLLKSEGGKTKIPTNVSFQDWDCTALFQATLYAPTFALPDSTGHKKILSELYINKRKPTSGTFHPNVNSPSGDPNETNALAIDQLRLLRNTLCHSSHSSVTKAEFDNYVQLTKDAFTAIKVSTSRLEAIGNLAETDFPTTVVHQLNERMKGERDSYLQFLQSDIKDDLNALKHEVNQGI